MSRTDARPPADVATTALAPNVRARLMIMMFGEFFVWGMWFVTLGTFLGGGLGASGTQISLAYLTQSLGAILAPFVVGLIADRFFSAQKILGVLHLAGGVLLLIAATQDSFTAFFPVILVYMILFMPTLALANSISFRQLSSPERQFPAIRVLGTIGWIVAGLLIGALGWEQANTLQYTFVAAGVMSLALGAFSFFLPATPPTATGEKPALRDILGLDALALLKHRTFLTFFVCSILICIPLAFYYNFTNLFLNEIGVVGAAGVQSLGQMSEVLFLLLMPFLVKRLGFKTTLALGMAAWAVRYVCFAFGDPGGLFWLLIVGIVLHGICYDFFFVAGQIYTDRFADAKLRSAAQGLIALATYGIGLLIGSLISGPLVDAFVTGEQAHDWTAIWLIPAGIAAVVLALFLVLFRDRGSRDGQQASPAPDRATSAAQ